MVDKVVVTGLGTINPLGKNIAESWGNIIAGVSGVGPITVINSSELLVKIACEVKNFIPEEYIPAKEVRRRDRRKRQGQPHGKRGQSLLEQKLDRQHLCR